MEQDACTVGADPLTGERHELDKPDGYRIPPSELDEVQDFVVVNSFDNHHVELDSSQPLAFKCKSRFHGSNDSFMTSPPRDDFELDGVERIQAIGLLSTGRTIAAHLPRVLP